MVNAPHHYLARDAQASRLLAHADLLRRLAARFDSAMPGPMQSAARLVNYKAGVLVVHADNGAVAAKLRQLGRRLCEAVAMEGVECVSLEVRVQPVQPLRPSLTTVPKPLTGKTCEILRSTAENLPKGPLRDALTALLSRAAQRE